VAVLRRAQRQSEYQPVIEDWIWHNILPMLAYAALVVAGFMLPRDVDVAPYFVGGSTLLLVFIGIHNAWDTVTYITILQARRRAAEPSPAKPEPASHDG